MHDPLSLARRRNTVVDVALSEAVTPLRFGVIDACRQRIAREKRSLSRTPPFGLRKHYRACTCVYYITSRISWLTRSFPFPLSCVAEKYAGYVNALCPPIRRGSHDFVVMGPNYPPVGGCIATSPLTDAPLTLGFEIWMGSHGSCDTIGTYTQLSQCYDVQRSKRRLSSSRFVLCAL